MLYNTCETFSDISMFNDRVKPSLHLISIGLPPFTDVNFCRASIFTWKRTYSFLRSSFCNDRVDAKRPFAGDFNVEINLLIRGTYMVAGHFIVIRYIDVIRIYVRDKSITT